MIILRRGRIPKIKGLGITEFFGRMGLSAVTAIWAIYLNSIFNNPAQVGFFSSFMMLVSFLSYIFLIPLIERNDKTKIFAYSVLLFGISYLFFAFTKNVILVLILGVIISVFTSMRVTSFGIIVRDSGKPKELSKNEGIIYTALNFSFVLGPIIAGYLALKYGFSAVFVFAAFMTFLSLMIFRAFRIKDPHKRKRTDRPLKTFFNFFKDRERRISYLVSGGISTWWAFIYIYMPIYLIEKTGSAELVGIFLGAICVPLVLTEYMFGRLANKKGFRKFFFLGYLVVGTLSITSFFISNIYLILGLMIIASFGMAMLEPTTEAYFFDVTNKKERDRFYGPYNTTISTHSFLGRIVGAVTLLLLPFKSLFLIFGAIMFIFMTISLKTKQIIENDEE